MHTHTSKNLQLRRWLAIGVTVGALAISALTSGAAVGAANPNDRFAARDTTIGGRDDVSDRRDNVNQTPSAPSVAAPAPSYTIGPSSFLSPALFVESETNPLLPGSFQIDRSLDRASK